MPYHVPVNRSHSKHPPKHETFSAEVEIHRPHHVLVTHIDSHKHHAEKSTYSAIRSSNHSSRPLYVSIQDLIHAVTGFIPAMVFLLRYGSG